MSILSGLYRIVEQNDNTVLIKLASEEHPVFKAHFPSYPILPGFALIDIVAESLNDVIVSIKMAKFIVHVKPNDRLSLHVKRSAKGRTVQIFKNKQKVSEIRYETM